MSDMEYITYKMIEISKLNSGGDRPKIYSDIKTNECCFPIFSNGLQDEGLYGYTNKATMPSDTITVSARGANIGEVFYRKEEFLPIVRLITIIPDSNYVHSKYLYYYLKKVKIEGSGSAQPQITVPFFSRHKIVIPKDVEYQKKVADYLSTYDNLIENNNKRIKLLEQMAENLYKEWFVRFRFPGYEDVEFEDGMPKNWVKDKIRTYYETTSGGTPKRSNSDYFESGNIPWLKTGELNDSIILDTDEHITELGLNKSSAKWLPKNSVAMAMYAGSNVGKLGYLDTEMTCSQACCILYDKRKFSSKHYLFHYLLSIREYLQNISFGAAQQNISQDLINKVNIIMPNDEVVRLFEEKINDIYNETRILLKQNKVLIQQRDMLLPRLMSGKLEV